MIKNDNKISSIAKTYAQALLESASETNECEKFQNELKLIQDTLAASQDLIVVMGNSSISTLKKNEILNEIFSGKIDNKVLNFLKLLTQKNRFEELTAIINAYNDILQKKSNKKNVEIISAINLNFEAKSNILFKLEKKLQSEIIPQWTVNEDIIAGLVFKFDDYVIDTSISAKIKNLSKNITR